METTEVMYGNVKKSFQSFADQCGIIRRKRIAPMLKGFEDFTAGFREMAQVTAFLHQTQLERERINADLAYRHRVNVVERYRAAGMFGGAP